MHFWPAESLAYAFYPALPLAKPKSLLDLATQSFPGMVFWVLLLLLGFSAVCWYIIGHKYFFLRRAQQESDRFLDAFWGSKKLDKIFDTAEKMEHSPTAQVFCAGYIELSKLRQSEGEMRDQLSDLESVERAMRRAQSSEVSTLEKLVPFLATTGSTAPFVGLFGTVWGIMNSFRDITSKGSASIKVVAPGIAEALIATAIGLMAAIPAVIAYNYFVNRIKTIAGDMDAFSSDFLNIVKRHLLK